MLTPVQWYIDLQADKVIQSFFDDPDWYKMWCRRPLPPNTSTAVASPDSSVLRAAANALAATAEVALALSEAQPFDIVLKAAATSAVHASVHVVLTQQQPKRKS